jgi:VIT1/CCC1 family predicted Fe2+/Mn2+ transporter
MSVQSRGARRRVLDPVERMSEVVFGLIMVLSFTGSMSVATAGHEEVRAVLIGAVGCNLAWGIVDGVMYLLTQLIERGRSLSIGRAVRASPDAEQGRKLLVDALPEPLDRLFDGPALECAREKLAALPSLPDRPRLRKDDWLAAFGIFLLVFLSTFPVVLPFLFFSPLHLAMRVSECVAIVMLYAAGQSLGRHAELGPTRTGLVMVGIGVVLVVVTIALGG